jgi:hypothetical protein
MVTFMVCMHGECVVAVAELLCTATSPQNGQHSVRLPEATPEANTDEVRLAIQAQLEADATYQVDVPEANTAGLVAGTSGAGHGEVIDIDEPEVVAPVRRTASGLIQPAKRHKGPAIKGVSWCD